MEVLQALMPSQEQREEHPRLRRVVVVGALAATSAAILISTAISLRIVFPGDSLRRPFCGRHLPAHGPSSFLLTDQETVDYFWTLLFLPSALLFLASALYLIAGILVAYHAPTRHGCLKLVENNYCASTRGGVRCLSILNVLVAIAFGLLALFLGSTLLTFGSRCSVPLFWCYEIALWGLVLLYGGTAFFLRQKAAVILDESDFAGKNLGLEMLEANTVEFSPDVGRRVTEGFRAWMGPGFLSSDEEDEPEDYKEVPSLSRTNSSRHRLSPEV